VKNRAVVGTLAAVVVAGLVVAGLFAVGSPATARKFKADQERRNRLSQLHFVLASHVRSEGTLPGSLEDVQEELLRRSGFGFDARRDPETGELFEYRREGDRRYEVCAVFHMSSDDRRSRDFGPFPGDVTHEPGRNCYNRTLTDQDVDGAPDFFDGRQFPERIVPDRQEPSPSPSPADETTESPQASPEAAETPAEV